MKLSRNGYVYSRFPYCRSAYLPAPFLLSLLSLAAAHLLRHLVAFSVAAVATMSVPAALNYNLATWRIHVVVALVCAFNTLKEVGSGGERVEKTDF